ncbi:hypothetical protein JIN85_13995 [Luteolibacter pohnpeiensis]|uniref:Uncharacterized protein n=1 Tax=Luteolibacter pohnpeiensis TaxID=454153 RepID=A0A934SE42_9BACT|nr:hypothetical protein [Luteolibacter pohnpeiensis]MBK1883533.1 hypothetical protein [Luteolibacter pohnpeiensis]
MREDTVEYEIKLMKISARGEWIVADAAKKFEEAGFNAALTAHYFFLHGVLNCFPTMDIYDQAELLHLMDRFTVEKLSDLIRDGIDIDKTPFAMDQEALDD